MYRLFCYMVVGLQRPFLWQIGKIENTAYKKENKTIIILALLEGFVSVQLSYKYFQRPQFCGIFTSK